MARMLRLGMCCAVVLGSLAAGAARADESASREPAAQEKQIQTNLRNDRDLANNVVDVRLSSDGVATLRGVVDSDNERRKAVQLASVPGVRVVDDQLKIGAVVVMAPVPDSAITTAIENDMFAKADLRNGNVSVTTDKGVVTLTGTVPSPEVRRTAVNLARHTNGVVLVEDRLQLAGNTPSDPEVPLR